MSTKNIVLFGQTGAGKSSLVNLMAGEERADTSPDTLRCTMHWKEYPIAFDGYNYRVFDTMGLTEPQLEIQEYLDAIVDARNLIMKLDSEGGIDLLLFCVRASKVSTTTQNNYRLFYEWLCEKKVPIVLVVTGLEGKQHMEDWWTEHETTLDKYEVSVNGHACITAAANKLNERHQQLYEESRQLVCNLVKEHTHHRPKKGDEGWFRGFISKQRERLRSFAVRKKDIVTVLTTRCGVPEEVAIQLAGQIGQDVSPKSSI
jgi:tRNA U34 5-carboxymethylaminomethyl modifying GTPase MnmE/TrmE